MKHLYQVRLNRGCAVVVASHPGEVVATVCSDFNIDSEFIIFIDGEFDYDDEKILDATTEISGYEVKGESGVISYYKEV